MSEQLGDWRVCGCAAISYFFQAQLLYTFHHFLFATVQIDGFTTADESALGRRPNTHTHNSVKERNKSEY